MLGGTHLLKRPRKNCIFDAQFPGNWFWYHFKWFLKLYNVSYLDKCFIRLVPENPKNPGIQPSYDNWTRIVEVKYSFLTC